MITQRQKPVSSVRPTAILKRKVNIKSAWSAADVIQRARLAEILQRELASKLFGVNYQLEQAVGF